jgi:hypothetical protein
MLWIQYYRMTNALSIAIFTNYVTSKLLAVKLRKLGEIRDGETRDRGAVEKVSIGSLLTKRTESRQCK